METNSTPPSVHALAQAIRTKERSVEEVVTTYLTQIAAVNPQINAVIQLAPKALAQARQADQDLANGIVRGPLHGVPFTVKDVFATANLVSPLDQRLRQRFPTTDATVVSRLRAAGAILLGKTNCPPNGSGSDTENAICGRTLNPHDLTRTPGGSSGGEAALIAAGASPFGLGSDVRGGLRVPAHYCGVTSLKPTTGRIPNTGVYNQPGGLSDARSQSGLLAQSVEDVGLLLPLLLGVDYEDSGVIPMPWRNPAAVRPEKLKVAYFISDPLSPVTEEIRHAVGAAAQALARARVTLEVARPTDFVAAGREIDAFWQDLAGAPGRTVVEFYAMWDNFRTHLLQFMQPYDALLCPVTHQGAPLIQERDPRRFDYTVPFSLTGYPCVVTPVAVNAAGLPLGVQIVAHPWREDIALTLAHLLEQEYRPYVARKQTKETESTAKRT
ncbi:MAG: amidase [Caldilinea sp. CFX5]|nr:amidase [Caldilinea sp. CFX5]